MRGIALIVLIGASGCGLSDYQNRMDAQRLRVQEFDDGNRLLDDPIDMPRVKLKDPEEQTAWPFEIFLRLPKGYSTAPKETEVYKQHFPFCRYSGGSEGATNLFVAAAWIQDSKKDDEPGRYDARNFRDYVRGALGEYYLKTYTRILPFPEKVEIKSREVRAVTPYPDPSGAKIPFKTILYTDEGNKQLKDHSAFEVYLREQGGKQVCIVVQRPARPANAEGLNKSIDACLGSLDIGSNASVKRYSYKKAKGI
jgi:hypothetical protein